MTKLQTRNLYIALAVTALVVCAVLIRVLYLPYSGFWRTLLYNALIGAWGVSVWWRILQRQTRNCLLLAAALMLLWLDLRLIRFDFAQSPTALRRLWYAYYIPMLLIPTLAVYALFYLDRSQSRPLPRHRYILFAVPVALFTLVLTNDCHQLVFAFPPGQEVSGDPEYTYRFGYYLCVLWILFCALFTVVYLVRRCRIPHTGYFPWLPLVPKDAASIAVIGHTGYFLWLPLVPIGVAVVYGVLYILQLPWLRRIAGDMTVVQCLTFTAAFEACIQCGLIQSNTGYSDFFAVSPVRGLVTDSRFVPVQASAGAQPLTEAQMRQAVGNTVTLNRTTLLHGHPITGGYIFWQEDISELVELLDQMRLAQEELNDIGDIIQAETAQKAKWLQLSEQNRLYDQIEAVTARQLARIRQHLVALQTAPDAETAQRLLRQIVILGTYIKRRSNLVFVCDKAEVIDTTELRLSLFESAESLRLCGIRCAVQVPAAGQIPAQCAVAVYDAFEAILEATLPGVQNLLFCAQETAQGWSVRCSVQGVRRPDAIPGFPAMQQEWDEDGLLYLSLCPVEGERV